MPVPEKKDGFTGSFNRVSPGVAKCKGGSRTSTVTIGGAENAVFGGSPGQTGEKPKC